MSTHLPEVVVCDDAGALAEEAARRFIDAAGAATAGRGRFAVALAGGSTPAWLYRTLTRSPYCDRVDWLRTLVFFGDERCVPPDHQWSNYRMAREALLDRVSIPSGNVFRMAGELAPDDAAAAYSSTLSRVLVGATGALPVFDLVLLGMGEDGHTASLFPGLPALDERLTFVVATAVPGYVHPPVCRVTLTLPAINASRQVLFLVAGATKKAAVRAVLGREDSQGAGVGPVLPAGQVVPVGGNLAWLLDRAAAGCSAQGVQ